MPQSAKFTMALDRSAKAANMLPSSAPKLAVSRLVLVGATMLFWTAVVVVIKLLAS